MIGATPKKILRLLEAARGIRPADRHRYKRLMRSSRTPRNGFAFSLTGVKSDRPGQKRKGLLAVRTACTNVSTICEHRLTVIPTASNWSSATEICYGNSMKELSNTHYFCNVPR